jgi:uncharacterized protein (TIGR02145 family)
MKNKKTIAFLFLSILLATIACNKSPEIPILSYPANEETDINVTQVKLIWNCIDSENDILTFDLYFGTNENPDLYESNLSNTFFELPSLEENTTYYWKIVVKDKKSQSESQIYHFETLKIICIDYDENEYKTTIIGNQIWMAENLKSTHYADGRPLQYLDINNWPIPYDTVKAYCYYNDSIEYFNIYGAMYTFSATTDGKISTNNPNGIQGICPNGWHVPRIEEYGELMSFISNDGLENVSLALKTISGWPINGEDYYNFSAQPNGSRMTVYFGLPFDSEKGKVGYWRETSGSVFVINNEPNFGNPHFELVFFGTNGYCVRCLKDIE